MTVAEVRADLLRFWGQCLDIAETRDGLALALPMMYPDGWQVQVYIHPGPPGQYRLSDHGNTLERASAALQFPCGICREGAELVEQKPLPVTGRDIHVFAEKLVRIAFENRT